MSIRCISVLILSLAVFGASCDEENPVQNDPKTDSGLTDVGDDVIQRGGPNDDDDGDGLTNKQESDGWEISVDRIGLGEFITERVTSDPLLADTDSDGLTDGEEFQKTDPNKLDTDGDGLTDTEEVQIFLSIPTSVDSDGDSVSGATSNPQLWDGDEVKKWGTSPSLSDTDGDNKSDFDEIINNATNPLVAQVPAIAFDFAGEIDVRLNVTYEDSQGMSEEYGDSYSLQTSDTQTQTDSSATKSTIEHSASITAGVKTGVPTSVSVTASYGYKDTATKDHSTSLTDSSGRTAQEEYQRANTDSTTRTQKTASGSLSIGMTINNPSELAYTLTNLAVSVFQWDAVTQNFKTVGTLEPQLEAFNLAPGEAKDVPQQISASNVNPDLIREFLREPKSLFFSVANFDMENAEGFNFAFLDEVTSARTGRIIIDYGNGTVEDFLVATNVRRNPDGSLAGVTLDTVFTEYLKIPYATEPWVAIGTPPDELKHRVGLNVLTEVRGVKNETGDETGFWAVFSSEDDLEIEETDFGKTVLQRGESLHIVYLKDKDGDGVYDREEAFHSSDNNKVDTDDDTLTDFEEVKEGWIAGTGLDTNGYPRQVFSDPTIADADNDGLDDVAEKAAGTDPHNPDTDSDGVSDSLDNDPLDNSNDPPTIAIMQTFNDPVVSLNGSITDTFDPVKTVTIDWGDGTNETITSGFDPFSTSHGYLTPGTYTISIVATDERNSASVPTTFAVTTTQPFAQNHYGLNGGFTDSVGGKNANLTHVGGSNANLGFVSDRFNMANSAFAFDYTNVFSYAAFANTSTFGNLPMDNFAVAFWAKLNGGTGYAITQPNRLAIELVSNRVRVSLGREDVSPLESAQGSIPSGWTFIVVSKDGPVLTVYANGVQIAQSNRPNVNYENCETLFISGTNLSTGCPTLQETTNSSEVDERFLRNTILDDIRFFDRPLSVSDIQSLYLEGGFVP